MPDAIAAALQTGAPEEALNRRGRTTVHLDAGALFEDHVVEVRLDPRTNIREILLAG